MLQTNNSINTPTVSLNTPVVALHTPGLGGSYHGIFTDLSSTDMGLSSALNWSNQIAHNRYFPLVFKVNYNIIGK